MSIKGTIGGVAVHFSTFSTTDDKEAAVNAIVMARGNSPGDRRFRVLFIDTPPTPVLFETIQLLRRVDYADLLLRDHHDVDGPPKNPGEQETRQAADTLRALLGDKATISNRTAHPACSLLVSPGEFAGDDMVTVIADPDPDGLLATMKALGVLYSDADGGVATFDADAALFDGPPAHRDGLSPLGSLLNIGWTTLPEFNSTNRRPYEKAVSDLFGQFVSAVQGDGIARAALEGKMVQ